MPRFLCLLTAFLSLLFFLPAALPCKAKEPSISGECGCLYLPQLDKMLWEKNADVRRPMASTTKIMTALVVLENCALDEEFKIPAEAVGVEGSSVYLEAGEVQSVENMLYALLLASANDAATALAIHTAGSVAAFAELMNRRAEQMGLTDTHFTNPHGLADKEHYTTARELAKITQEAMKNPQFREIVSTKNKVISVKNGSSTRTLTNHNRLLRCYDDCIGVKTGFTKNSGRCLVTAAERSGMLLIAVTLHAPDDWRDHTAMLDYGFSQYEGRLLTEASQRSFEIPVVNGTQNTVSLLSDGGCAVLKKDSPPLEISYEINRFAVAPLKKGAILGIVRYTQDGATVATVPLYAAEDVDALPLRHGFWDKIKNLLKM